MSNGIFSRDCSHVTTPRAAWNEGERGRQRYYAYLINNLVIGDEIEIDDGRKLVRGSRGHYTLWANDLQVIVTLPKADAMIEYLITGKVCARKPKGHKGKTSKYIGVCRTKNGRLWKAQITVDGADFMLGYFVDEDEAARAWDDFVTTHNLIRPLNFPQAQEEAA